MDLAIGSTASLQTVQDPTGAPPAQPKTSTSAAETVAETGRQPEATRSDDAAKDKPEPKAEAAPAESRDAPPPPPSESGRGQLVDIAA